MITLEISETNKHYHKWCDMLEEYCRNFDIEQDEQIYRHFDEVNGGHHEVALYYVFGDEKFYDKLMSKFGEHFLINYEPEIEDDEVMLE